MSVFEAISLMIMFCELQFVIVTFIISYISKNEKK
ncbi:putative holin-like toxin [Staphylococcus sp. IVB6181]